MIKKHSKKIKVLLLMSVGSTFGVYFNLPIGAVMGSFLAVAIAQVMGLGANKLNVRAKQAVQMVIGGIAGLNINSGLLHELKALFIPGLLVTISHLIFSLLVALLLQKFLKVDFFSALCGSIPAGMSEITIIADDLNADVQLVALMHLFRVSILVTLLPILITSFFL